MSLRTATFDGPPTPAALASRSPLLAGPLHAAWTRHRRPSEPRLVFGDDAALLVTRRPATATIKVCASAWPDDAPAARIDAAIGGLIDLARGEGAVRLVWELDADVAGRDAGNAAGRDAAGRGTAGPRRHPAGVRAALERRGFVAPRAPIASGDGTVGVAGLALDLVPLDRDEPAYYAQTTDFTCGAVTALLALGQLDATAGFAGEAPGADRDAELAFWRRATNFPAIDPLGLLVELRRELPEAAAVEAWISVDGPVLLEGVEDGFERDTKVLLQRESARQALALRAPVHRAWLELPALARRIRSGALALVLIDEVPMHDDPTPHWVLAHAAHAPAEGEGFVLVQDPWIDAAAGETWLDGHELAIASASFDAMARWGEPAYRAVVLVEPRALGGG